MKEYIIDIQELTDSRELLSAKPPIVMRLFIYALLLMLYISFAWIWFAELDIVVKAPGIIRPAASISNIKNIVPGEIEEIHYTTGTRVNEGDLLYTINVDQLLIQKDTIETQLLDTTKKEQNLILLKKSITEEKNYLTADNEEYYNKYLLFSYQLENARLQYNDARARFNKNKELPAGSIAGTTLQELHNTARFAELELKRFISETRVTISHEIDTVKERMIALNEQLSKINVDIEMSRVVAPIQGEIQVIQRYNRGDYIQSGTAILNIIPGQSQNYTMEIMVSNKDIAHIEHNIPVKYRFQSLPHNEYGIVTGNVIKIPGDISAGGRVNDAVYIVEASIDKATVISSKGKSARLKIGMICDARIIVRKKKILFYLLEKLDFMS